MEDEEEFGIGDNLSELGEEIVVFSEEASEKIGKAIREGDMDREDLWRILDRIG